MTNSPSAHSTRHTLAKAERLCSVTLIDRLFKGEGSRAVSAFPLRMVYRAIPRPTPTAPPAQMLVSVPKKHFHHAVDRNRAKRQVREAYRLHKHTLYNAIEAQLPGQQLLVAFIYIDGRHHTTAHIDAKMSSLLQRLAERLAPQP